MSKLTNTEIQEILENARNLQKPRRSAPINPFAKRLAPIIKSPEGKNFLIRLMDVAFRSKDYSRIALFVNNLFKSDGSHKKIFNTQEKILVRLFNMIGHRLPSVSIPLMLRQIQDVTSPVVFFIGDKKFKDHSLKRKKENIQLNVNLIGEALIGEAEAQKRIEAYIKLLNHPEVDYISIKISTIYSQIDSIAHDQVVDILVDKLSIIYQEVLRIEQETGVQKFINLDMEEYRDLSMTIATFKKTLNKPEFQNLRAGIVLQAYLPDCYEEAKNLKDWAIERVKNGGSPVKVRIVKGANREMELTEASIRDWHLATYDSKLETDANYKKVLQMLLTSDNAPALNVGVASHNIFDLAFAMHIVQNQAIENNVDFEMLEGVANGTVQEISNLGYHVLLYTPIVEKTDYNNAIAYLVRRLDEGTQDGNFLKEGFNLDIHSPKWNELRGYFLKSIEEIDTVRITPFRTQNRATQKIEPQTKFKNVADTDWTLEANRNWIQAVKERWAQPLNVLGDCIPVIGGDPSQNREKVNQENWKGTLPWQYELATEQDYHYFLAQPSTWAGLSAEEKAEILRKSATIMEAKRGDLIGVAIQELGKTVAEVDVEVSEAIDFANYYAQSLLDIEELGIAYTNEGVNLVLSPWNFPIAIPIGGVLGSLAAGKRVVIKPSQNAAACAYLISECLWEAGVSKNDFAFLPTQEKNLDPFLSKGNVFDAVILTGGTDTAKFLLKRNPSLNLCAETGGKNATIITALSDRDQAIKDVVQSAFGNTGQKCSATSLLILENEVYQDAHFKQLLKDAVESKILGDPWDFKTQIGPLAVPVNDRIKKVLIDTPDEEWLVKPILDGDYLLSPGVKWGVKEDDFGYQNELFGPILFVMKADGLYDAIRMVNNLDYGLTSGLESLDKEEIAYWKNNIKAGNLYVNRGTTGAIVQRQPFGGIKASSYGFGMKAGGPNYILQFMNLLSPTVDLDLIEENYKEAFQLYFNDEKDISKIRGQHNILKYLKPKQTLVLVDESTSIEDATMVMIASEIVGASTEFYTRTTSTLPESFEVKTIDSFMNLDLDGDDIILRSLCESIDDEFKLYASDHFIYLNQRKPHINGRVELLNYLKEQSLSINYHRYGNLMGEKID